MRLALSPAEFLLSGFCGLFVILLMYQLAASADMHVLAPLSIKPKALVLTPTNAPSPPSLAAFDEIEARPLFNPARTPVAVVDEKANAAAPPPAPNAALIGLIIDNQSRLAILKVPSSPLAISVGVGAKLDGWEVSEIQNDKIILTAGSFQHDIALNANTPSSPSQSPTQRPAIPQSPALPPRPLVRGTVGPIRQMPPGAGSPLRPPSMASQDPVPSMTPTAPDQTQ